MNPLPLVVSQWQTSWAANLTLLVLLGLCFSITISVSVFERSLREASVASSNDIDLVVGAPGSDVSLVLASVFLKGDEVLPLLSSAVLDELSSNPRVRFASPLVFADHFGSFPIVGIGEEFSQIRSNWTIEQGRWPRDEFEVTVGAETKLELGATFHGSHGIEESDHDEEHDQSHFTVVGRLNRTGTPWDRALLTPYRTLWRVHGLHESDEGDRSSAHGISAIVVKPKSFSDAYALRAELKADPRTVAVFPAEILTRLFGLFRDVQSILELIAAAVQVSILLTVLSTLVARFETQKVTIELLRAIGAPQTYAFLTLWLQGVVLIAGAVVFGTTVGWIIVVGVSSWIHDRTGLPLSAALGTREYAIAAIFVAAGFVGALVPSFWGGRTRVRRAQNDRS